MAVKSSIEKRVTFESEEESTLFALLQQPLSRNHILMVVKIVESRPQLLGFTLEIVQSSHQHDAMVASWLLSHLYDSSPELLMEWQPQMVQAVLTTTSDSVRRNLLRILEGLPLKEDQLGILFDTALRWMISENHAIAVRANAMQLLYRISCLEPALIPELRNHIEALMDYGTAGFRSRGKIILKKLQLIDK